MTEECSLCFFKTKSKQDLFVHTIKYHKNDPSFKVRCTIDGCNITYEKWRSYQQHVYRCHKQTVENNGVNILECEEENKKNEENIPNDERGITISIYFNKN